MEPISLTATHRERVGTREARRMRRTAHVPAVVYGQGKHPVSISVNLRDVQKALHTKAGTNVIISLKIGGVKKAEEHTVIVKELQYDPVQGNLRHVDFHQISLKERITVNVPILLKGEAIGVKQAGGVQEHFLRELTVECLPTEIPPHVDVEISALAIGDVIHVKDIAPPANVKVVNDPELVVVSILPPHVETVPEVAAAEAPVEPELIRKKKEAEGEEAAMPAEGAKAETKAEKPEAKKEKESK